MMATHYGGNVRKHGYLWRFQTVANSEISKGCIKFKIRN